MELVKECFGKQDQYAAAFGGMNILQFNPDESVDIEPVLLDYKKRLDFENHLLIFFTGITRDASPILAKQSSNTETDKKKFETLKDMAASVDEFSRRLLKGNFK